MCAKGKIIDEINKLVNIDIKTLLQKTYLKYNMIVSQLFIFLYISVIKSKNNIKMERGEGQSCIKLE